MNRRQLVIGGLFSLLACGEPRSTKLPADLADFSKIQSSLDKLDSADRRRVAAYEMRARLGGLFGGSAPAAGGVTIGQAIDNQKAFEAKEARDEAESKALAARSRAEHEQKLQILNQALTVALTQIGLHSGGEYDFQKQIGMTLAFQNKTPKAMAGVKGVAILKDMFGDTINTVNVSYDKSIPANSSREWNAGVSYNQFMAKDVKLANTPIDKIRFVFEPSVIVFEDGTRMEAPAIDH
jgi:hypothetical protein